MTIDIWAMNLEGGSREVKKNTYDYCRLHVETDQSGLITFTRDSINRLTSFTDAFGKTASYGYDRARKINACFCELLWRGK